MIPANKQAAVEKALQSAFGVNEFEDIQQLVKGLSSALVFKIMVRGNPYLLRVITSELPVNDPAHYFACMQPAAEAGIAPPIYYLNTEDRVSITGFITEQFFPIDTARKQMADLLRRLHALPKFPFRINYFGSMEGLMEKFLAVKLLPSDATDEIFEAYRQIVKIYPCNDAGHWVSCHNDLKPENILFDGMRPWLVDWEAAFLNDPYLDLAVVGNFVVKDDTEESEYLETYFGQPADEYQRARFFIMSEILHAFYFGSFMLFAHPAKQVDINKLDKLGFKTYHDRIRNGEMNFADSDAKIQYAWEHREEFLRKLHTKRFNDSLQIISEYHNEYVNETEARP